MSFYLRIQPKTNISINTPIIYVTLGYGYLSEITPETTAKNIYDLNIDSVRETLRKRFGDMFENTEHINDYVQVGQIYPKSLSTINKIKYDTEKDYYKDSYTDSDNYSNLTIQDRDVDGDEPKTVSIQHISTILVNTRIVPMSNEYVKIGKNIWIADTTTNNIRMRSLSTIYSEKRPEFSIPVFPLSFLERVSSADNRSSYELFSDKSYGVYVLNDTALNIDKLNMRMINPMGRVEINPRVFVPMNPRELSQDNETGLDKKYNRKVYFTAQGSLAADDNCVKPIDNMMKMHMMECNGYKSDLEDNYNTNTSNNIDLTNNIEHMNNTKLMGSIEDDRVFGKVITEKDKKIVLREKDEPWFTDPYIVGEVAEYDDPHTVTGHNETLEMTESELYEAIERLKPKGSIGSWKGDADTLVLIGTFDGDTDEINMPYNMDIIDRDCDPSTIIGYSRYDKLQKCLKNKTKNIRDSNIEYFNENNKNTKNNNNNETDYDNNDINYNNYIMIAICIIIIVLMIYRIKH